MISPTPNETLLTSFVESLKAAYSAEEAFWKQKSRQLWLQLGDRNTSFFHASTRKRFAINKFSALENEEGIAVYEEDQIEKVITDYFRNMFTSRSGMNDQKRAIVMGALVPVISTDDNQLLIKDPSACEVKEALFAIHPDKAPGPDGFSANFFQSNWEVVGPDIITEVQEFFRLGTLSRSSNDTYAHPPDSQASWSKKSSGLQANRLV